MQVITKDGAVLINLGADAVDIAIADAGAYFAAGDVEAALQELSLASWLIGRLEAASAQKWDQQFNNMLKNGSFESWSAGAAAAPDAWTLLGAGASVAREATIIRFGEYSAKVTRGGADCYIYQLLFGIDADTNTYWRGRTVTMGCWVYATVASRARISIHDGVASVFSSYHTGGSSWEFLTVSITLNAAATALYGYCQVYNGDTDGYFDGAILVEGPICPAFAPKPAEEVAGWMDWVPTLTGDADLSGYTNARFYRVGNTCFFNFYASAKNVTTGGVIEITLPFTSANVGRFAPSGQVYDGAAWIGLPLIHIVGNTNILYVYKTAAAAAWAGTENNVTLEITGFYEIA